MVNKAEIRRKELAFFLEVSKIPFKSVEIEPTAHIVLEGGVKVESFSNSWNYASTKNIFNNDYKLFTIVTDKLQSIDLADSVDAVSSIVDIAKYNTMLSNTNKALKGKGFRTNFLENKDYGGMTAKRNEIFILYKGTGYDNKDMDKYTEEYLNIVPGINYHELGHTMFTISFKRLAKVLENLYFTEFDNNTYTEKERQEIIGVLLRYANVFEDGRMENLMVTKFAGSYPYFASMVYDFLLKQIMTKTKKVKGEWIDEHDCVLFSARKYISPDIRQWVYNEYIASGHGDLAKAQRVNGYVNKFITLSWRKNLDEMCRLVIGFYLEFGKQLLEDKKQIPQYKQEKELTDLLEKLFGDMMSKMNEMDGSGEGQSGEQFGDSEGNEIEDETLKEILSKMAKEGKLKPGKNQKGNGIPVPGKGDKGSKGKDSNPKPAPGAGSGIEKHDGKGDEEGEEPKEGSSPGGDVDEGEMQKKITADMKSNQGAKNANRETAKKIMAGTRLNYREDRSSLAHTVTPCMSKEQRKLEAYFKQLITQCRNGYMHKRKSGAVDVPEVRRQLKSCGSKVFRKYKKNMNKAFDVDIAFLLDTSSSMDESGFHNCEGQRCTKVHKAAEQLWICFTAAKSVGGQHKTFLFSSGDQGVMPEPKNSRKEYAVPRPYGGTVISPSLMMAMNYLESSKANNKWLVVLSDGELADTAQHNEILDTARRMGVITGKINLGYGGSGHEVYDHIYSIGTGGDFKGNNHARDIVAFFKKIYEVSMKRNGLTV